MLYIFIGAWHGSFNGMRQYLAAAILFSGHRFIKERKFKEYCWAHLRNLLSPFKNMIGLINGFSEGKVNTELLRSFKDKLNLDNNEKEFLEFCDFLEKK